MPGPPREAAPPPGGGKGTDSGSSTSPGLSALGCGQSVHLLDGGVNDNTGLPTLWEAVQHLRATWNSMRDSNSPLTEKTKAATACHILQELLLRGVVLLVIDSGAKPHMDALSEVQVPAQA